MKSPVSLILPTYNERENIEPLIREVARHLYPESEIIVVDDNSPDETWKIVSRLKLDSPRLRLLRRMEKPGLTASLRAGIEMAAHDTVLWMDADFAHPPSVLPRLLGAPATWDIVLASRYVSGGGDGRKSRIRRGISLALNQSARKLLGTSVSDLSTGYLRVSKKIFAKVPLEGNYGDYCISFLARAEREGFSILEVPYSNLDREKGSSKTTHNPLVFARFAAGYLLTILRLRRQFKTSGR